MIDLAWYSPRECSRSKTSKYLGRRCSSCLPNINVFFPFFKYFRKVDVRIFVHTTRNVAF